MTDADLVERMRTLVPAAAEGRPIDTGLAWRQFLQLRSRAGRSRRRRLTAALAAVAAAAILVPALAVHRLAGLGSPQQPRPRYDAAIRTRVYPGAVVRLPVGGVLSLVADGPSVWAVRAYHQNAAGSSYQLVKIDARTNQVTVRVGLGVRPRSVAAAAGVVWLTTGHGRRLGQLVRLDQATGRVVAIAHLATGRCDLVTFSPPSLWALCEQSYARSQLLRLDPATGRELGRTGPLHGYTVALAATAGGGAWFPDLYSTIYSLVRPGGPRSAPSITVRVPKLPASFSGPQALGQGFVWALAPGEDVAKIDLATGRVLRVYSHRAYDPALHGGLDFLAAADGSLWLLDDGYPFSGVLRVSMATGRPLGAVAQPRVGDCGQSPCAQIYATPGAVWVPTAAWLLRIDPAKLPG